MAKQSGGGRIKSQGKSLVWTPLLEDQKKKIRAAAGIVGKPMSQFLVDAGLAEAEKILKKTGTSLDV